jgi:alkylation response protein AidB-like acyl-CoA dehydrogenase
MIDMYRLNADQKAIVERAADVAERELAPRAMATDERETFPRESVDALAQAGFLGLTVPTEHGGMGQGLRVACAVLDQIGQRCPSTGMIYMMHLCGVATYAARPDRASAQLRAAALGRHLSTLAWSEVGSGSDFWAPVSRESRSGGRIFLNADKSFVTSAGYADGYVVSTGWSEGKAATESMLYLVLKDEPGLSVSAPWRGLGLRGNASGPMRLEGVRVAEDRALSEPGKGLDVMLGVVLPVFQLANAAVTIGMSEGAVAITQKHLTTKKREHVGGTVSGDPTQRARLARMRVETDRARAHLVAVLDALEAGSPAAQLLVLEIKTSANETAVTVTDLGMRACGGSAFRRDLGLERLFRDARAPIVMAPTTDQAHDIIGRALCGMELLG